MAKTCLKTVLAACFFLLASVAAQAVPPLISYQGQLNDQNGVPVNGTVSFIFSIYDVPMGGTALWTEAQTIPVSDGIFNVQLGAVKALPTSIFNQNQLYLGIKAGADEEMTPRQLITPSAYSLRAELSVPIGSIIAWNKSMPETPPLPVGWVECNGQVLSDSESPYDGATMPDLNGQGRLLFGGSISGTLRTEDYNPPHTHQAGNLKYAINNNDYHTAQGTTTSARYNGAISGETTSSTSGTPFNGFQVVWIMRVR